MTLARLGLKVQVIGQGHRFGLGLGLSIGDGGDSTLSSRHQLRRGVRLDRVAKSSGCWRGNEVLRSVGLTSIVVRQSFVSAS